MAKIKKIFKFATGNPVPEGAEYLCTKTQLKVEGVDEGWISCWLVWHYFLVEVEE